MKARVALVALVLAACARQPELSLAVRLPTDQSGLTSINRLILTAERGGIVLAQSSFSASTRTISLASVSHGASTVLSLDGVDLNDNVIARGSTCPIDFESGGMTAPLYFAPTSFFAPTVNAPLLRQFGTIVALSSGSVLLAGGSDSTELVTTTELFTPGAGTFAVQPTSMAMKQPRWHAESIALPSIGALVVGGVEQSGNAIANGELYYETQQTFLPEAGFDARVEHRIVLGRQTTVGARALVTGGSATLGGAPLSSTLVAYALSSNGAIEVTAGPAMARARRSHAAVGVSTSTNDRVLVFGGYGSDRAPVDSIELTDFGANTSVEIAHLAHARAEATATLIPNVGVLIAGGIGSDGAPRADAELFDLLNHDTTVFAMQAARRGHSATLLSNGNEVLIAGGYGADGNPLGSAESFFATDTFVNFVSEPDLTAARADHIAVPLCDGTALIVGSAPSADLFTEPK